MSNFRCRLWLWELNDGHFSPYSDIFFNSNLTRKATNLFFKSVLAKKGSDNNDLQAKTQDKYHKECHKIRIK